MSNSSDNKLLQTRVSRATSLEFAAASHEDQNNPGVFKKVLFSAADLPSGKLQMLNLAKIPAGKGFGQHAHKDMYEIFVITSGQAEMRVGRESFLLGSGDSVLVPPGSPHSMRAMGPSDVDFIVFGIS